MQHATAPPPYLSPEYHEPTSISQPGLRCQQIRFELLQFCGLSLPGRPAVCTVLTASSADVLLLHHHVLPVIMTQPVCIMAQPVQACHDQIQVV